MYVDSTTLIRSRLVPREIELDRAIGGGSFMRMIHFTILIMSMLSKCDLCPVAFSERNFKAAPTKKSVYALKGLCYRYRYMNGWYGNVYEKAPTSSISIQIARSKNMRLYCGQHRGASNPVSCDIDLLTNNR